MSDCNRNIPDLLPGLVTLQLHIIRCELIEVPDLRVQPELRRREGVSADELLNGIHVAGLGIDMGIRNDMHQLAHVHIADLCQHMHQHRILYHIPVVGCQYVLGTLV